MIWHKFWDSTNNLDDGYLLRNVCVIFHLDPSEALRMIIGGLQWSAGYFFHIPAGHSFDLSTPLVVHRAIT
jgi:hypothetical protein